MKTITIPAAPAATRRSFAQRMNLILPSDLQIRTTSDEHSVKAILFFSLTFLCPLFIIPAINHTIAAQKGGTK